MGYIMGLFMRPIALPAPVRVIIRLVGAGGYRMFMASRVIGAILITLGVIGLAGAMAIRPIQENKNYYGTGQNLDGTQISQSSQIYGYYQGPEWPLNAGSYTYLDGIQSSWTVFPIFKQNCPNAGRYEDLDGFLDPSNPQK